MTASRPQTLCNLMDWIAPMWRWKFLDCRNCLPIQTWAISFVNYCVWVLWFGFMPRSVLPALLSCFWLWFITFVCTLSCHLRLSGFFFLPACQTSPSFQPFISFHKLKREDNLKHKTTSQQISQLNDRIIISTKKEAYHINMICVIPVYLYTVKCQAKV